MSRCTVYIRNKIELTKPTHFLITNLPFIAAKET